MIIKVKDMQQLMERHACCGAPQYFKETFEVHAIRIRRRKLQYLVVLNRRLRWWDYDLFEIIDSTIPLNWVVVKFKRFHKFKNKKYDFKISTNYYQGPIEFLENEDFLFDIYENTDAAYSFFLQYLECKNPWNEEK